MHAMAVDAGDSVSLVRANSMVFEPFALGMAAQTRLVNGSRLGNSKETAPNSVGG